MHNEDEFRSVQVTEKGDLLIVTSLLTGRQGIIRCLPNKLKEFVEFREEEDA